MNQQDDNVEVAHSPTHSSVTQTQIPNMPPDIASIIQSFWVSRALRISK